MNGHHDVVDVELTAFVHQSRKATAGGQVIEDQWAREYVEEKYMAKMDEFTGDGTAAVTVSGSLAHSDFGTKAESFVAVKLPCGATIDEVLGAHSVAREIVEEKVQENLARMEVLLGVPLPGSTAGNSKVVEPAAPQASPQKRKITIKKPGKSDGAQKPSYRR